MTTQELHVVFGATGGAGSAVVRELVARGQRVRAVSRKAAPSASPLIEPYQADVFDAASARAAAAGATVVYNCTNAPYTDWPRLFPLLWRNVTAAAAAAEAKLVIADNLYMYGSSSAPLTESTPYRATGRKGATRIAMTEELLAAQQAGAVRVVIGRAADYYGPQVSLAFFGSNVFRSAQRGKRVLGFDQLDLPHSQAFIDDVARGLVTLGTSAAGDGQVWHLPHAPAITQREFIQLMFAEAGQQPKIGRLPAWVLRLAGLAVPIARELAEMAYQYSAPFVVDCAKFERAFGLSATPYRVGIRATLEWLRTSAAAAVTAH